MIRRDRPRVLLLWPGGLFDGGANFGVPGLLSIARAIRDLADVEIVDLDMEGLLHGGPVDFARFFRGPYDLVGICTYSSYDYLKTVELAKLARAHLPRAWLVTGGYHASACPEDFDDTAFDYVAVGDGEAPMRKLVTALITGKRPLLRILRDGEAPPADLGAMPYEMLAKYMPVARRGASQAEIYLSRGCPYDCSFCMERAKRDTSWRALEAGEALEEIHRLDSFLDLSTWTLFIADALFGMKKAWRRAFLEGLARKPIRARKTWLLIRVDLVEREDMDLFARANIAPGFGLESGDPSQLRRIRKAGRLEGYLDHMMSIAEWARELNVPFGANIIVGHPGETEETLRTSARYMTKLFTEKPTMGFLSVDPFRLYPGSPIAENIDEWKATTGFHAHRYPWWHDGDQSFLSEWVDPSTELSYDRALALRYETFRPLTKQIRDNFAYRGPSRDYFVRALDEQVDQFSREKEIANLGMRAMWGKWVPPRSPSQVSAANDGIEVALARVARELRETHVQQAMNVALRSLPAALVRTLDPALVLRVEEALVEVPREAFVREEDVERSHLDRSLPLSDDGASTISAMHAYAAAFLALDLREGDSFADLGAGSGYGAALAARIVGPSGRVIAIEWSAELARLATTLLEPFRWVVVHEGDAHDTARWAGVTKAYAGFSSHRLPRAWVEAISPSGTLVAPVGGTLVRVARSPAGELETSLANVHYVGDRASASA